MQGRKKEGDTGEKDRVRERQGRKRETEREEKKKYYY